MIIPTITIPDPIRYSASIRASLDHGDIEGIGQGKQHMECLDQKDGEESAHDAWLYDG